MRPCVYNYIISWKLYNYTVRSGEFLRQSTSRSVGLFTSLSQHVTTLVQILMICA